MTDSCFGSIGACTILVDGRTARACLMLAVQAHGRDVRTVESLARDGKRHPIQQAFWDHHGLQCGSFAMKHTAHGTVTGDATEETPSGYDLTLWCSCGETFAVRVTPEMALDDFIAQAERN